MATWTLSQNGHPAQSFASWFFVNMHRKLVSQGVDTCTFDAEGQNIDAANQLNFGDKVVIYKNTVPWFQGTVTKTPVKGTSQEESHSYEVSGPWYFFENQIFEQTYVGFITNIRNLTPPAVPQSSDYQSTIVGGTYVGTDGHTHNWPSWFKTAIPYNNGNLLIRAADGAIFGFQPTSHVFLNSWIFDSYGRVQTVEITSSFGVTYFSGLVRDTGQQITQALLNAQDAQTQILGSPAFQMGAVQTVPSTVPPTVLTSQAQAKPYYRSATVSPEVPAVVSEQRDISVAEVIRNQLRWSPDAVAWFDYSTTPPTFHINQRSSLDAVLIPGLFNFGVIELTSGSGNETDQLVPILGGADVSAVSINPRYDLKVPFVRINYEQNNTVNGLNYMTRVVDVYPAGSPTYGFCAMINTIDLRGYSSGAYADLVTSPLPDMQDGLSVTSGDAFNWWKGRKEWPLARQSDVIVDSITLNGRNPVDENGNPIDYTLLPNELISGSIADWMSVYSSREQVTATIFYHTLGGQQIIAPIQTTLQSTSAASGTYNNSQGITYAEPVPVGLAKLLYESVEALQYDGEITITEDECSGIVELGQVLNMSPNWEDMNAMVVQIDENVDQGTTQVSFGPKKNLGASDLVELVRVIRNRIITFRFSDNSGSYATESVGLGIYSPVAQADHNGNVSVVVGASQVKDPNSLDPSDPQKITAQMDSNTATAGLRITGRQSQSELPEGDGVLNLALQDLINNQSLNN
jgi:hypothetical protein